MISKLHRIRDDMCFCKQYIRIMRFCNSGVAEGQITVFSTVIKVSLIDKLSTSMSYDMAAKERPWSDLSFTLRLKLSQSYTFNLSSSFATYAYEADSVGATPYVGTRTEYSKCRFGRFQGMSQNL